MTGNTSAFNTAASPVANADALLDAYLAAGDDVSARTILGKLFTDYAQPWCRESTRKALRKYALRNSDVEEQAAETEAEVMLRVTARLSAVRGGGAEAVDDLQAYIACCVYNACFMRLRAGKPERFRLENRLRYLLRHDSKFGLWEAGGEAVAGHRRWTGKPATGEALAPPFPARDLAKILQQVFDRSEAPVSLGSLISVVAQVLGVSARNPLEFLDSSQLAGRKTSPEDALCSLQALRALWPEVLALPLNQRVALVLNLRDEEGQGVIEIIPAAGLASFEELAGALGMAAPDLAALWDDLPMEDSRIGEVLGITRQQVINLRKAARCRLARRTARKSNIGADPPSIGFEGKFRAARKAVGRFFGGTASGD